MKKNVIFIGGPMAIGKSTISQLVVKQCPPSAFLDGDWCWAIEPFIVTEEHKKMVLGNISFLLRAFLANSQIETIVFCWVLDHQTIIDSLIQELSDYDFAFLSISLIASEEHLTMNFLKDVTSGTRSKQGLTNSLERLPLYENLDSCKLDITNMSPDEAASQILQQLSRLKK